MYRFAASISQHNSITIGNTLSNINTPLGRKWVMKGHEDDVEARLDPSRVDEIGT